MVSGSRSTRGRVATKANPFDPGPLPAYISAPRLERIGMKAWKTVQFRQIQGKRNAKKRRAARAARARYTDLGTHLSSASLRESGAPGLFVESMRIQMPQMGRKRSSVAFEREMRPQSVPKSSQGRVVVGFCSGAGSPMPRMRSASTSVHAKSMVVRDISHTQCTAYCIAAGYSAQSQADQTATLRL